MLCRAKPHKLRCKWVFGLEVRAQDFQIDLRRTPTKRGAGSWLSLDRDGWRPRSTSSQISPPSSACPDGPALLSSLPEDKMMMLSKGPTNFC